MGLSYVTEVGPLRDLTIRLYRLTNRAFNGRRVVSLCVRRTSRSM